MAKKYIILDTETTGLEVRQGHRMIEIGAVVLNDRKKSENSEFSVHICFNHLSRFFLSIKEDNEMKLCVPY